MNVNLEHASADLFSAFAKAQADMAPVLKNAVNPAFKSRYADLANVLEAVLPSLNRHGLMLVQMPGGDGEAVTVTSVLGHTSGAYITSTLHLRPTKSDPQGVGSAITYGRRYAALAICGVAPEDDDGAAASRPANNAQASQAPAQSSLADRASNVERQVAQASTVAQIERIEKLAAGLFADLDRADPERLVELRAGIEARTNDLAVAA